MNKLHRIANVLILLALPFVANSQQIMSTEFRDLDHQLQQQFKGKYGFSVLVADESRTLFRKAYGYADTLKTRTVDEKTLFNIASISKSFTAIGIARLAEQHKLHFTDTLGVFFNHIPRDKKQITIHQLLTHTSGFQQNYVCEGKQKATDALQALLSDKLSDGTGTRFGYSNENFEMLALIIEAVTHTTYEDFIRKEILTPLAMNNTHFWNEVATQKNIADKNRALTEQILNRNWDYIGSGGIYSTSADLHKFIDAVITSKIISKESQTLLFNDYVKTSSSTGVGYGWFINPTTDWNTKELWTRGTEDWGHNAVIRWFTDKKTIIIVCTNSGELGDKQITGNRLISNFIADFLWKKK
jgi:CubicO group peptidase (beta-lactamase class C family)